MCVYGVLLIRKFTEIFQNTLNTENWQKKCCVNIEDTISRKRPTANAPIK